MGFLSSLFGFDDAKPAQSQVVQAAKIPEELKPYVTEIMESAQTQFKDNMARGYVPYTGKTTADLTPEEVKEYIRYIADRRLLGLGMKKIFGSENNPLPWLDYMLNGVEHTNFFENRATEYARASTTGNWQDIFK